jgi:hypothetical protein
MVKSYEARASKREVRRLIRANEDNNGSKRFTGASYTPVSATNEAKIDAPEANPRGAVHAEEK